MRRRKTRFGGQAAPISYHTARDFGDRNPSSEPGCAARGYRRTPALDRPLIFDSATCGPGGNKIAGPKFRVVPLRGFSYPYALVFLPDRSISDIEERLAVDERASGLTSNTIQNLSGRVLTTYSFFSSGENASPLGSHADLGDACVSPPHSVLPHTSRRAGSGAGYRPARNRTMI